MFHRLWPKHRAICAKLRRPQKNVEQPRALQIIESAKRAHKFSGAFRAFLQETVFALETRGIGVCERRTFAMLQPRVAMRDEMRQAEMPLFQPANTRHTAAVHAAVRHEVGFGLQCFVFFSPIWFFTWPK